MHEWLKVLFLVPLHLVVAPAIGLTIRRHRAMQKLVFFLLMVFTICEYTKISMSPWFPDPLYRGHTRGYECTVFEVLAIILIFANIGIPFRVRGPWLPPGLLLWILYCFVSLLSIFNAQNVSFTLMAFVKFTKASLIFAGAFQFFREENDIRFWLRTISVTLIFQMFLCIAQKYIFHIHQVHGWFEHQNAMVMHVYMIALPLLAAALSSYISRRDTIFAAIGFICGGISAVLALSRLGLLVFTAGAIAVAVLGWIEHPTRKRLILISSIGLLAMIGSLFVADSIIRRFKESATVSSETTRDLLNECSRRMNKDYPIFGVGWNNYGVVINPPYKYGDPLDEYAYSMGHRLGFVDSDFGKPISESWYYLMLAETGWVGLSACMLFVLTMLFWNARAAWYFRHTLSGTVAMGILVGTGLNYLQSGYERVLTQPKNLALWMICLAIVSRLEWWRRQNRRVQDAAVPASGRNG